LTAVRARLSRGNPELLKKFDAARGRIENAMREVSGETRMVDSRRLASVGPFIRVWNTLTTLGGAVISAVTDTPIRASALRQQGQSYLKNLADGVVAPIKRIAELAGA